MVIWTNSLLKNYSAANLRCCLQLGLLTTFLQQTAKQMTLVVMFTLANLPVLAQTIPPSETKRYFVEFAGDPLTQLDEFKRFLIRQGLTRENGVWINHIYSRVFNGVSVTVSKPEQTPIIAGGPNVIGITPVGTATIPRYSGPDAGDMGPDSQKEGKAVGADEFRRATGLRGHGIRVAIIDSGVDLQRAELRQVKGGKDFVGDAFNPASCLASGHSCEEQHDGINDLHGHGTHLAGIIAANSDTVSPDPSFTPSHSAWGGIANRVDLWAYRVFARDTVTFIDIILAGLEQAAKDGIRVLLLGFETQDTGQVLVNALQKLQEQGVIVVVGVGDSGERGLSKLAEQNSVLSVGAVGEVHEDHQEPTSDKCLDHSPGLRMASFSARGPNSVGQLKPDLVAPGQEVRSAYLANRYQKLSGTAVAAAHVAGLAALLLQSNPELTLYTLRDRLQQTAVPIIGSDLYSDAWPASLTEQGAGMANICRVHRLMPVTASPARLETVVTRKPITRTLVITNPDRSPQNFTAEHRPALSQRDPLSVARLEFNERSFTIPPGSSFSLNVTLHFPEAATEEEVYSGYIELLQRLPGEDAPEVVVRISYLAAK